MQLVAALAFGLVLFGAVALVAAMLRAEFGRVLSVLAGDELRRARMPRPVVVVSAAPRRRSPARPLAQRPLHAAAA